MKQEKKRGRKPVEYDQKVIQKTFRMLEADVEPVSKLVVNYMKKHSQIKKYKQMRKKK